MADAEQPPSITDYNKRPADGGNLKRAPRKRRQIREAEVAAARDAGHVMAVTNLSYALQIDMTTEIYSEAFWKHQFDIAENTIEDFKTPELPLARVKRVMKTDPEVAMIASEVPVILEKACQIFISDLTARAFLSSSRRKTLNKQDIANASVQDDLFDFLIDVLQRDQTTVKRKQTLPDTPQASLSVPDFGTAPPDLNHQSVKVEERSEASSDDEGDEDDSDEDYCET